MDAAEHVQQGETETLSELFGGSTGETGTAPEGEAAWERQQTTNTVKNKLNNNMKQSNTKNWKKKSNKLQTINNKNKNSITSVKCLILHNRNELISL